MTTASGTITYTTPYASARAASDQEAYSAAIGSYSKFTTTAFPATGNAIQGWKWDQTVWTENTPENYSVVVPSNWDPTTSGITKTYFQSGIGSNRDLEFDHAELIPSSGINSVSIFNEWAPVVRHGQYYEFEVGGYLYSDDSEVEYFTYSGVDSAASGYDVSSGFNIAALDNRNKVGVPVEVVQYKWDESDGEYEVDSFFRKRVTFTGSRDADLVRQDTYDDDRELILWDNVDRTNKEFIVTYSGVNPAAITNQQCSTAVGWGETAPSGIEVLGYSTGETQQQFHTEYAPIDSTMGFEVYSYITSSGSNQLWDPIDFSSTPSGYQVKVDYDLGLLEFNSTTSSGQEVPAGGETVGVRYWKTYKLEYEPELTDDIVTGIEANVNPIYRRSPRGFVYLSTKLSDPISITLSAELPEIQTNVYGPLTIGNTFAPIIATVKDQKGNELEGQSVTFRITSSPVAGAFGSSTTVTTATDEIGQAKAFYNPPRNIDEIGEQVDATGWTNTVGPTDPEYSGIAEITSLSTTDLLIEGTTNDIFTYKVYADDPHLGYLDSSLDTNSDTQVSGYYQSFFTSEDIQGSTRDVLWEDTRRLTWELSRPTIFQSDQGMGRKLLVSKIDSSMLNPYTFEYGAVGPMQPVNVVNTGSGTYDVVFDTTANSMYEPGSVNDPNLNSYFVVAPTTVSLQASVYNARLNKHIFSNEISVKLTIPTYLSGLWYLDAINQNHIDEISSLLSGVTASGQYVPLGFRLKSSTVTLAAALDGVTFLDLNRQYNYDPWDQDVVASGLVAKHKFNVNEIT